MYPNFSSIFRITVIAIIFTFFLQLSNAQSKEKIDFKYKVESIKAGEDYSYNIKITILSGEGPFMIGVYENTKDNLIELDKKEDVYDTTTSLAISGKKDCVIYVRNSVTGIFKTLKY